MAWLSALIKSILDWLAGEVKKDTKAGDADDVPKELKDRWRERIENQEKKINNDKQKKRITGAQALAQDKSSDDS